MATGVFSLFLFVLCELSRARVFLLVSQPEVSERPCMAAGAVEQADP